MPFQLRLLYIMHPASPSAVSSSHPASSFPKTSGLLKTQTNCLIHVMAFVRCNKHCGETRRQVQASSTGSFRGRYLSSHLCNAGRKGATSAPEPSGSLSNTCRKGNQAATTASVPQPCCSASSRIAKSVTRYNRAVTLACSSPCSGNTWSGCRAGGFRFASSSLPQTIFCTRSEATLYQFPL